MTKHTLVHRPAPATEVRSLLSIERLARNCEQVSLPFLSGSSQEGGGPVVGPSGTRLRTRMGFQFAQNMALARSLKPPSGRVNLSPIGSRDALIYDRNRLLWRQKLRPPLMSSGRPELPFGERDMSGLWMSVVAAQKSAAGKKPANRRYYVFQILGGIAIALLIGGALLIAATFNG